MGIGRRRRTVFASRVVEVFVCGGARGNERWRMAVYEGVRTGEGAGTEREREREKMLMKLVRVVFRGTTKHYIIYYIICYTLYRVYTAVYTCICTKTYTAKNTAYLYRRRRRYREKAFCSFTPALEATVSNFRNSGKLLGAAPQSSRDFRAFVRMHTRGAPFAWLHRVYAQYHAITRTYTHVYNIYI